MGLSLALVHVHQSRLGFNNYFNDNNYYARSMYIIILSHRSSVYIGHNIHTVQHKGGGGDGNLITDSEADRPAGRRSTILGPTELHNPQTPVSTVYENSPLSFKWTQPTTATTLPPQLTVSRRKFLEIFSSGIQHWENHIIIIIYYIHYTHSYARTYMVASPKKMRLDLP